MMNFLSSVMKQHNRMQLSAFIVFAKWNVDTITLVGEQLPFEKKDKNYPFFRQISQYVASACPIIPG